MKYIRYDVFDRGKKLGPWSGQVDFKSLGHKKELQYFKILNELMPLPPQKIRETENVIFAFKDGIENNVEYKVLIGLTKEMSGNKPLLRRELNSNDYDVIWQDETQVALVPKLSKRSALYR